MEKRQLIVIGSIAGAILILLLIIFGILPGLKPSKPTPVSLEFWGFGDDADVWREIIFNFSAKFPHIEVTYRRFPEERYEDTLVNSIASGIGPDVFMFKNSWITKHKQKIYPLPPEFQYSLRNFQQTFVDIASQDLITQDGQILGMPIFVDTLVLFYNKDMLNAAGIASPPRDWDEVVQISQAITQTTPVGTILRSGIAMGAAKNVSHAFEILSALLMQQGDTIVDRQSGQVSLGEKTQAVLDFYTSFTDRRRSNYSWNALMPNSLDAFASEQTAMAIGFMSDIQRIRTKNPRLNFDAVPLPQNKGSQIPVTYGSYFFPAVSKLSLKGKAGWQAAWQFVLFISSREAAAQYSKNAGRPPARRDLVALGAPSSELDAFWKQTLTARSWAIPDEKAVRRLFEDVIESIVTGASSPQEAVNLLRGQLGLLMPSR